MAFGEIPLIPFRTGINDLHLEDNVFTGTGKIYSPFTLYEITKDKKFNFLEANEHVYVSRLPLYNNKYYVFYLKQDNVKIKIDTDNYAFFKDEVISQNENAFVCYYSYLNIPFRISNLNLNFKVLPFTTRSLEARVGKIEGIEYSPVADFDELLSFDDLQESLTTQDISDLVSEYYYDNLYFKDFLNREGKLTDDELS